MRASRAFTLIEILVVLGILTVLAAILFPVLTRARESGRKATCIAQLSQLAKAEKMYSDDCDRTISPARTDVPSSGSLGITWCVLLQPYIRSEKVLICPDDPSPQATAQSTCLPHSYGINYSLAYNTTWGPSGSFVTSMSQVERVSDIIIFFELKSSAQTMGSSYYANRVSRIDSRHFNLGNFAFLDGHVKTLNVNDVNNPLSWDPFAG